MNFWRFLWLDVDHFIWEFSAITRDLYICGCAWGTIGNQRSALTEIICHEMALLPVATYWQTSRHLHSTSQLVPLHKFHRVLNPQNAAEGLNGPHLWLMLEVGWSKRAQIAPFGKCFRARSLHIHGLWCFSWGFYWVEMWMGDGRCEIVIWEGWVIQWKMKISYENQFMISINCFLAFSGRMGLKIPDGVVSHSGASKYSEQILLRDIMIPLLDLSFAFY